MRPLRQPQSWSEISLAVPAPAVDAVTAMIEDRLGVNRFLFEEADATGGKAENGGVPSIITVKFFVEPGREKESVDRCRQGLGRLFRHFNGLSSVRLTVDLVEAEDWSETWKEHFRPLEVGRKFLIVPAWEEELGERRPTGKFRSPAVGDEDGSVSGEAGRGRYRLVLDPGMAFGTGRHPTTAMMLELMETALDAVDSGWKACDLGTGSGILAAAAARLGARAVVALDTDPAAAAAAEKNAALNGLGDRIQCRQGSLRRLEAPVDAIFANIGFTVLHPLAGAMARRLRPDSSGGVVLLSGVLNEKEEALLEAYRAAGFSLVDGLRRDGWSAVNLRLQQV